MKKDYITQEELDELEELEERSQDIYYADSLTRDYDDYGMTSADQGFMLGYLDS